MVVTPDEVLEVVSKEASIDPAKLKPDATLESLGIASIDVVSIVFAVEDRFGLIVQPEDFAEAKSLQDVVDVVIAKSQSA